MRGAMFCLDVNADSQVLKYLLHLKKNNVSQTGHT
jgi:hypothetical protein